MNLLRIVARPLLAAPFLADGVDALLRPEGHVERIRAVDPLLTRLGLDLSDDELVVATRAMGAVTVAAAGALTVGRCTRPAAAALALVSVPVALVNAPVWSATDRTSRNRMRSDLRRSLALTGALVIASTDREGRPSLGWRVRESQRLRRLAREQERA